MRKSEHEESTSATQGQHRSRMPKLAQRPMPKNSADLSHGPSLREGHPTRDAKAFMKATKHSTDASSIAL